MKTNKRKVLLAACGGGGGGDSDAAPTSNPVLPAISISNATIEEGNVGSVDLVFSVSLSATSAVRADFSTADGAVDASDYQAAAGQVSISAGQTSVDVIVPVLGDLLIELDEDFTIGLTNPVNANLGNGIGVGSITNDDFPRLSVSDATVQEGNVRTITMSFDVTLDQPGISDITVDYATSYSYAAMSLAGQLKSIGWQLGYVTTSDEAEEIFPESTVGDRFVLALTLAF